MSDRIDIAYTWMNGTPHRPWCNFQRVPVVRCNCGRTDVIQTMWFLKNLPKDHVVTIGSRLDWVIEHPLSCRFGEGIADCPANKAMINFPSERIMNLSLGRYQFIDDGEGVFRLVLLEEQ